MRRGLLGIAGCLFAFLVLLTLRITAWDDPIDPRHGRHFLNGRTSRQVSETVATFVGPQKWPSSRDYREIKAGASSSVRVDLSGEKDFTTFFKVHIPDAAKSFLVSEIKLPVPITLRGRFGGPLRSVEDASHGNTPDGNSLFVSRYHLAPLESGWFYFALQIPVDQLAALRELGLDTLHIDVEPVTTGVRVDKRLRLGEMHSTTISRDCGGYRTFEVDMPKGAKALRIDLDRAQCDLNLAVRYQAQIDVLDANDILLESPQSREFVVMKIIGRGIRKMTLESMNHSSASSMVTVALMDSETTDHLTDSSNESSARDSETRAKVRHSRRSSRNYAKRRVAERTARRYGTALNQEKSLQAISVRRWSNAQSVELGAQALSVPTKRDASAFESRKRRRKTHRRKRRSAH